MKKWLIGSLVGALIVFGWQSLSWTVLGIHDKAVKYTASQNEIMNSLSGLEEGSYWMPSAPTMKERQAMKDQVSGKPWAVVIYHKKLNTDMVMPMIRGFLVDLFLVISLIYILTRGGVPIGRRVFSGSVAMGLAFFLWGPYMGRVWFQMPWSSIQGELIDSLVSWSVCGIWLGWWLNRKTAAAPKA